MRYGQSEKMEIIRIVEKSPLSVKQTLLELNINRSTFYKWYKQYQDEGYEALENRYRPPRQFWNEVPRLGRKKDSGNSIGTPGDVTPGVGLLYYG
jgi:transposase-like protein